MREFSSHYLYDFIYVMTSSYIPMLSHISFATFSWRSYVVCLWCLTHMLYINHVHYAYLWTILMLIMSTYYASMPYDPYHALVLWLHFMNLVMSAYFISCLCLHDPYIFFRIVIMLSFAYIGGKHFYTYLHACLLFMGVYMMLSINIYYMHVVYTLCN